MKRTNIVIIWKSSIHTGTIMLNSNPKYFSITSEGIWKYRKILFWKQVIFIPFSVIDEIAFEKNHELITFWEKNKCWKCKMDIGNETKYWLCESCQKSLENHKELIQYIKYNHFNMDSEKIILQSIPSEVFKPLKEWLKLIIDDTLFTPLVFDNKIFLSNLKRKQITVFDFKALQHKFNQTYNIAKNHGEEELMDVFNPLKKYFNIQ